MPTQLLIGRLIFRVECSFHSFQYIQFLSDNLPRTHLLSISSLTNLNTYLSIVHNTRKVIEMECETESSGVERGATCPCGSGKSYQECCGCECGQSMSMDPVEHAKEMWHKSFFQAMNEAQVERLRKRIESAWGPTMDKMADAVMESFGKYWQSMLLQSEAKKELEAKLQKIFAEANKKP